MQKREREGSAFSRFPCSSEVEFVLVLDIAKRSDIHRYCACGDKDGTFQAGQLFESKVFRPSFEFPPLLLRAMSSNLFTLYIVNKAGGLIFNRVSLAEAVSSCALQATSCFTAVFSARLPSQDLSPGVVRLATNDYLTNASTFHSLHAISKQVSPVHGSGGITSIDAPTFSLHCLETLTGLKLFVTAKPGPRAEAAANAFLGKVYEAYGDYVAKNPFYETDMPIRLKLFDAALDKTLRELGA